jgi:hypothetical protein
MFARLLAHPRASFACAACARAAAPLAARARGAGTTTKFFVRPADDTSADFVGVEVADGADVDALKKAALVELRVDAPRAAVALALADGDGSPLDPTLSLADAGLQARAKLVLSVRTPPRLDPSAFANVIVRRHDATLGAHAAAVALRAAGTDALSRVRALGDLVADVVRRDPGALGDVTALPLFVTLAHKSLLEALSTHARALAAGDFAGSNGTACRTLVGPRGIGKTVVLRAFAAVCATAFPSLVAVYVTGESIFAPGSFRAAHLHDLVVAAARDRGANVAPHCSAAELRFALEAARLRVLVLLDEVDELYTVSEADGAVFRNVRETLGMLSTVGGGTSGLFGLLACGSSASTHALICADVEHLADRFPLVRAGVPNLNDTKFRRLALETAPCSSSNEVEAILAARAGRATLPDDVRPLARQLTFFVGVSPRAVGAVLPARGDLLRVSAPDAPRLPLAAHALYGALLDAFVVANAGLRALTLDSSGAFKLHALSDARCDWEGAVTPLEWPAVESAWAQCTQALKEPRARDGGLLMRLVDHLADAQLVHIEHVPGGVRLWPTTAAQVVAARARPGAQPSLELFSRAGEGMRPLLALIEVGSRVAKLF